MPSEAQIEAEAEALANLQNDNPTEEDFQAAEAEIRAKYEELFSEETQNALDEHDTEVAALEEQVEADEEEDEENKPWINNGAVITLQLVTDDFVGDPVEAAEQIMLDIVMHGLHHRALVVTDAGDGQEYIVQEGVAYSPEEYTARQQV